MAQEGDQEAHPVERRVTRVFTSLALGARSFGLRIMAAILSFSARCSGTQRATNSGPRLCISPITAEVKTANFTYLQDVGQTTPEADEYTLQVLGLAELVLGGELALAASSQIG